MFGRNPEKLEAKAANYESRGKTAKAAKYRQKAAALRAKQGTGNLTTMPMGTTTTTTYGNTMGTPMASQGFTTTRTPAMYEQRALKWEQRGNYTKAQKNREKIWRLQNPSIPMTTAAPMFYDSNNRFLGYNQGLQGSTLNRGMATQVNTLPPVVETHVHPTIIQQTTRPEKIVEVQPIVHREIDAPSVHVVEKHSYEQVRSTGPGVITNQPIVQETIHPRVIEEIQPVVHREVPAPFVEHVEQHVTERVVQPTTMTKDIINEGLRTGPAIAAGGPALQPGLSGQQGLAGQQGLPLNQGLAGQQGLAQPGLAGQQGLGGQNLNRPVGSTQPGINNNLRR